MGTSTWQKVNLVATWQGYDVIVHDLLGNMANVMPAAHERKVWRKGYKRDTGDNRWVDRGDLRPGECSCDERSGLACRACQDWHTLTGEEIPFC